MAFGFSFAEKEKVARIANIFQRLYDSEINFSVSCFWDGGFDVKLGDGMNGYDAETKVEKWEHVGPWLDDQACKRYPTSLFATGVSPPGSGPIQEPGLK